MLYIDFGVTLSEGINGVGLRAVEVAQALASAGDVVVVSADTPQREIVETWSGAGYRTHDDFEVGAGDIYWYGFATPVGRIAAANARGATCVFDAIVWPLEFTTYEGVRSHSDPAAAYGERVDSYLQRLRLATRFTVASDLERHVVIGMLSVSSPDHLYSGPPDLDGMFYTLPIGFSQVNENANGLTQRSQATERPLVVWNGGTWNHYQPEAAVQAVVDLNRNSVPVDLHFLYPQRGVETESLRRARAAAGDNPAIRFAASCLGLLERVEPLRAASASICAYGPHALWDLCPPMRLREAMIYNLPLIAPRRGALGSLIEQHAIGVSSADGTPTELSQAIAIAIEPSRQAQMRQALRQMSWSYSYEGQSAALAAWLRLGAT